MAYTLQWQDLSLKQINQFYDTTIQQDAISLIEAWFPSSDESKIKKSILYDFYYFILMFAQEINLEPIQISIFFSIMKKTHEVCIASPFMKLQEDYDYFQKLVLMHSIDRPPMSKKYFSLEQMKQITEYATNTYFRHYTMYKYTFTKQQKLTLNTIQVLNEPKLLEEEEEEVEVKEVVDETENEENKEKLENTQEEIEEIQEGTEKVVGEEGEKENQNPNTEDINNLKNDEEKEKENNEESITKNENEKDKKEGEGVESEEGVKEGDNNKEENKEEKEKELTPREKAIIDLKQLVENAIGPKIQELKNTLTTMLTNSEDQLIKQMKKMEDAKKKAAKEAMSAAKDEKDKKGGKGEKDKKGGKSGKDKKSSSKKK
ncbi:hypothetical protein H8356DRAFT_302215 [Neocallimastix lanati (nom. inval.)]|jgi:hypothetical protein|nr:hypothetical protein H8356DRAFT_302215 [Neocallimastix sp. JGI-2020a]